MKLCRTLEIIREEKLREERLGEESVPFHFLLLAIGAVLDWKECVCAYDIRDIIEFDRNFKSSPKLSECILALDLMEEFGFIKKIDGDFYHYERNCDGR